MEVEGDLGGWAAGNVPTTCPTASAGPLPAGPTSSSRSITIPAASPRSTAPGLAIYFCKKPVRQTLHWANATNTSFRLPPGQSNIEVKATWSVPVDVEALARHAPHAPARPRFPDDA